MDSSAERWEAAGTRRLLLVGCCVSIVIWTVMWSLGPWLLSWLYYMVVALVGVPPDHQVALLPSLILLNPYGAGCLAIAAMGVAEVARRRLFLGSVAIAVLAYGLPLFLFPLSLRWAGARVWNQLAGMLAARSTLDERLLWSQQLSFLTILLYLGGGVWVHKARCRSRWGVAGTFLILPGGAAVVLSSAMVWNGLHSLEWRNRGIAVQLQEATWHFGALHVVGTLDLTRADPRDFANLEMEARYSHPLAPSPESTHPVRLQWLDREGKPPERPGRYRFRSVFEEPRVGPDVHTPHEFRLTLIREVYPLMRRTTLGYSSHSSESGVWGLPIDFGGRFRIRELRAPLPPPPSAIFQLTRLGAVERSEGFLSLRISLRASRPGTYRIEASLEPSDEVFEAAPGEEEPLRGRAPHAVEIESVRLDPSSRLILPLPPDESEASRYTPLGSALELLPEKPAVLRLRWNIAAEKGLVNIRIWEAEGQRRLHKSALFRVS